MPSLQTFLEALAAAMGSPLNAMLDDGAALTSSSAQGAELQKPLKQAVEDIAAIYPDDLSRSPSQREILENFAFILAARPERYLEGMTGHELKTDDRGGGRHDIA